MSSQRTPWLLTGVTGGLGSKILTDMLETQRFDPQGIIATSRSASNRAQFEARGVQFRVADYSDRATLEAAFEGVENLLFMSSSEHDDARRSAQHSNVIAAAKAKGVGRVWYVSLAFGGWGDGSKIGFQQAHYETENELRGSGVEFVSLRAGIYSDAFPLFLNWYPSSDAVLLPRITPSVDEGEIAFTSRDELGEGMAALFAKGLDAFPSIRPKTDKNIILLTALGTNSLTDLVGAINRARGTDIPVKYLEPRDWVEESATDDVGGKGKPIFEYLLVFAQGASNGDAKVTDPALRTLLGREPETGVQAVERFLKRDRDFTWHQNHALR